MSDVMPCEDTRRKWQLREIQDEALRLFVQKNADYGDAFAAYGPTGVLVRIGDKLARWTCITTRGCW